MNDIEIFDIYDIWYEVPWIIAYKNMLMGSFIALISIGVFYHWYKKRFKKLKTSWQRALEGLAALTMHDTKLFYSALTAILKRYLAERYAFDVLSKTDWEMVEYLEKNKSQVPDAEDLKKIFSQTTDIKFSNIHTAESCAQEHLTATIRVIKNSIPNEKK